VESARAAVVIPMRRNAIAATQQLKIVIFWRAPTGYGRLRNLKVLHKNAPWAQQGGLYSNSNMGTKKSPRAVARGR